jgi:hypothetical protein
MMARIALYALSAMLISLSGWAIADRSIFLYQLWRSASPDSADEILLDLRVMSALSALMLNFVPLGLAIGLYQRANWARTLTLVLAIAILIPTVLAELGILQDNTPMKPFNWLIIGVCSVVTLVLINPAITSLFRHKREPSRNCG